MVYSRNACTAKMRDRKLNLIKNTNHKGEAVKRFQWVIKMYTQVRYIGVLYIHAHIIIGNDIYRVVSFNLLAGFNQWTVHRIVFPCTESLCRLVSLSGTETIGTRIEISCGRRHSFCVPTAEAGFKRVHLYVCVRVSPSTAEKYT